MHVEKFTHKGREFEIRALAVDQGIEVKSFHNGALLATYSVNYESAGDMLRGGPGNALAHLVDFAKGDIEHDVLPALKAIRDAA